MKVCKTMITKEYIPDWDSADGLREYVVNALDSDSPMEYSIGTDSMSITSVGAVLHISDFLLGKSTNRDKKSSVGKHGEGILTGAIPILREGGEVCFYNNGEMWEPVFKHDEDFGKEILCIEVTEDQNDMEGFTVYYKGSEDTIETVKDRCLYLKEMPDQVYESSMGRVFQEPVSRLYVGGFWVCDSPRHKYSYDFSPEVMPINRDRKVLADWDVGINCSKLLAEVADQVDFGEMVLSGQYDTHYLQYASTPDTTTDVVYETFTKSYGERAVPASDYEEADKLEAKYKGLDVNVQVLNDGAYTTLRHCEKLQDFLVELEEQVEEVEEEDERTPLELLEEWWLDNIAFGDVDLSDSFKGVIKMLKERGVSWDD